MVTKIKKKTKKAVMPDKEIKKILTGDTKLKATSKSQRLVAERNVNKLKALGWKVVGSPKDAKGKVLAVNTHLSDLILMER